MVHRYIPSKISITRRKGLFTTLACISYSPLYDISLISLVLCLGKGNKIISGRYHLWSHFRYAYQRRPVVRHKGPDTFFVDLMLLYGPRQVKLCFRACAKCADSYHLAHAQSLIRTFDLHLNICIVQWFCLRKNEGPDQTARISDWYVPSLNVYAQRGIFVWRYPYRGDNLFETFYLRFYSLSPSGNGPIRKGDKSLLFGAYYFLLEKISLRKEAKTHLKELPPLQLYPFPLLLLFFFENMYRMTCTPDNDWSVFCWTLCRIKL